MNLKIIIKIITLYPTGIRLHLVHTTEDLNRSSLQTNDRKTNEVYYLLHVFRT
jgi:hypothetical protein